MKKQPALTKGQKTYRKVIAAAARCIGRYGYHNTSFQMIADLAKVSQPLVIRYIGSRDELMIKVMEYMAEQARAKTAKALTDLSQLDSNKERLKAYIRISLELFLESSEVQNFYLSVYSVSAFDTKVREAYVQVKEGAIARIEDLLTKGHEAGEFSVPSPELTARTLHNSLTGMLLNWQLEKAEGREKLPATLAESFIRSIEKAPL